MKNENEKPADEFRKLNALIAEVEKRLLADTPRVTAWAKSLDRSFPNPYYGIAKVNGQWRLCFSETSRCDEVKPLAECSLSVRAYFFRSLLALEVSLKDCRSEFYQQVAIGNASLEAWLRERDEQQTKENA